MAVRGLRSLGLGITSYQCNPGGTTHPNGGIIPVVTTGEPLYMTEECLQRDSRAGLLWLFLPQTCRILNVDALHT